MAKPIACKTFYAKRRKLEPDATFQLPWIPDPAAGPSIINPTVDSSDIDDPPVGPTIDPAETDTSENEFEISSASESDPDYEMSTEEYDDSDVLPTMEASQCLDEDPVPQQQQLIWGPVDSSKQKKMSFTTTSGICPEVMNLDPITPIDVFHYLVTDDIYHLIISETNRNAEQVIQRSSLSPHSRMKQWQPTCVSEMKKILGLLIWMGLVRLPKITDYWSTHVLFQNRIAPNTFSRNRFQLLLKLWHFADNSQDPGNDRTYKVKKLMEMLLCNMNKLKQPPKEISVDESLVPFRGRLGFRQYIPGKAHKYGIKIYKLCDVEGYTYSALLYTGKGTTTGTGGHSMEVVKKLSSDYLNAARSLYADSFYSSVNLAEYLMSKDTHYTGTLSKKRAGVPKEVTEKKVGKGESFALMKSNGLVVCKWKDKRDVIMISTCHSGELIDSGKKNRNGEVKMKPDCIVAYNKAKVGIDKSDQMTSYYSCLRKTVRWYHKIAIEFILGTAIANTAIVYNTIASTRSGLQTMSLEDIRTDLAMELLQMNVVPQVQAPSPRNVINHALAETEIRQTGKRKSRRKRLYCKYCYQEMKAQYGVAIAKKKTRQVTTQCKGCDGEPFMCKDHFFSTHKTSL